MSSIELKHLAPYLPYGLRIKEGNTEFEMTGSFLDEWFNYGEPMKGKPILRSLSDLNESELKRIISYLFKDTKMIRPQMDRIYCNRGFITFFDLDTSQSYVAVKPGYESLPVLNMSNTFDDYSIFFELHIDMFGLIEKGLAIDINSLKTIKP